MAFDTRLHVKLPSEKHTHTIILLHGRDSTAAEFAVDFLESQASNGLTLPEIFPTFKWVFPASKLRTSARFQVEMSQWFDIWSLEDTEERKEMQKDGLRQSVAFIFEVVKKEMKNVPAEKIILGGISQGCATAIHALFGGGIRLGGLIGFCGWLPFQREMDGIAKCVKEQKEPATSSCLEEIWNLSPPSSTNLIAHSWLVRRTPVLLSHSKDDNIVSIKNGERLSHCLTNIFEDVEWRKYEEGAHWVTEPEGVDDMVEFIKAKVLG
jgi:lysophospholipase-2